MNARKVYQELRKPRQQSGEERESIMNFEEQTKNCKEKDGRKMFFGLAGTLAAGAAGFIAYKYYFQPWNHHWGAGIDDVEREMPGDDLIEDPEVITTRAIEISANPQEIFPWLVQMGQGRGGVYSYDWIERMLGIDMHNADRVVPELQHLEEGEFLPLGNEGGGFIVKHLETDRSLVLAHTDGNWTWDFGIYPIDDVHSKLVSRNRISMKDAGLGFRLYLKLIDPGAFVMERKMLIGIKERVERSNAAGVQLPSFSQQSAALSA
jgi:hypothetical protein